jgi:hypothetical protein
VVVRFTLTDGRTFEADKDIKVVLVDPQNQKLQPCDYPDVPALAEPAPAGETPLGMPRKEEPPVAPKDPKDSKDPPKEPEGPKIQTSRPGGTEPIAHWQAAQTPQPLSAAVQMLKPVPRSATMNSPPP